MKNKLFILFFLILSLYASGQDRYVVHFTDKNNSPYSISNPEAYLSQRAILRRDKQGIPISNDDLPVNQDYIDALKLTGADVFYQSKWFNAVLVQATVNTVDQIRLLSFVKEVELVATGTRLSKSGRTSKHERIEETKNAVQNNILGVGQLHAEGYYGEDIMLAFMDSGFEGVNLETGFQHLTDNNQILIVENFVRNNNDIFGVEFEDHGTRVLSTVAGRIDNEFTGSAPNSTFLLFVTEDLPTEFRIEEYNFLFAAEKADSAGVDIISTSLGYSDRFTDSSMDYVYEQMDGNTTVITKAAEKAFEKGILMITSAGNEGNNSNSPYVTAPADGPNVISIGSVGQDLMRSSFSSIGPNSLGQVKPELMALGASTSVINSSGSISSASGTSFSAPQITGLAALLWQREPALSNRELRELLLSLGNRASNPDNEYGYGVPNFAKLVTNLEEESSSIKLYPNPVSDILYIRSALDITYIKVFNKMGQQVPLKDIDGPQKSIELDLQNVASGIYLLQIEYSNSTIETHRISKSY